MCFEVSVHISHRIPRTMRRKTCDALQKIARAKETNSHTAYRIRKYEETNKVTNDVCTEFYL